MGPVWINYKACGLPLLLAAVGGTRRPPGFWGSHLIGWKCLRSANTHHAWAWSLWWILLHDRATQNSDFISPPHTFQILQLIALILNFRIYRINQIVSQHDLNLRPRGLLESSTVFIYWWIYCLVFKNGFITVITVDSWQQEEKKAFLQNLHNPEGVQPHVVLCSG